jgi:hypothetical protein
MIKRKLTCYFCDREFYAFLFGEKEDRDLIFHNEPYFFGTKEMYLNHWTLDFHHELDVPSIVSIWVCFPHLPLHCWGEDSLRSIGNTLSKYIDKSEPKVGMFACARIYVEVELEKGQLTNYLIVHSM